MPDDLKLIVSDVGSEVNLLGSPDRNERVLTDYEQKVQEYEAKIHELINTIEYLEKKCSDAKHTADLHERKLANKDAEINQKISEGRFRIIFAVALVLIFLLFYGVTLFIVYCAGRGHLSLSDKVLLTLIPASTVNILGLLVTVSKYLYPNAPPGRKTKGKPK